MKRDEYKMTQQVDTTDYKQKYEQALERAKKGECIENIFPELRESEDEKWRKWLIGHLKGYINQTDDKYAEVCKKAIAWLEKQGEQPSWSEEDEKMRNVVIDACKYMVENFENSTKQYEDAINWLESIKPNHWKPSQKQMEALCRAAFQCGNSALSPYSDKDKELVSLYNNLKKL